MSSPPYIELHAHSAFSFLDGASTPLELAGAAAALGYPALALTDHDGIWGSMEFAHCAEGLGLRPITGAELTVAFARLDVRRAENSRHGEFSAHQRLHLTLLVEDGAGYRNLCRLLDGAHAHTRDNTARIAEPAWTTLEEVERHAEGLVCLSGCARDGALAGAFERGDTALGEKLGRRLLAAFGPDRFRVELQRPYWRRDRARNRWLALLAERLGVPTVATGNVHAHSRRRSHLQDALVAIGLNETLESSPSRAAAATRPRRSPRPPRWRPASPSTRTPSPRPSASPSASPSTSPPSSATATPAPRTRAPTASSPASAPPRWPSATPATRAAPKPRRASRPGAGDDPQARPLRLLPPPPRHARAGPRGRARGPRARTRRAPILPPGRGRGSSVSSIVCYLTGLSHVDPVEAELFSGRFLNDETESMPDIDLDFPRDIREVLIPRVHERYGHEHSALVAAFPTYRPKGAVRDFGKALGLPPEEIDKVAKTVGFHESVGELERDLEAALGPGRARRAALAGRCSSSPPRRWACRATPPSTRAGW